MRISDWSSDVCSSDLWCAPRLICIVPSATALLSRPGETRVQRVAMPLQSTEGPTTKRPLPGSGASPAGGSAHNYLALLEARLPVAFSRGRLSGGALPLDSPGEPLTRLPGQHPAAPRGAHDALAT